MNLIQAFQNFNDKKIDQQQFEQEFDKTINELHKQKLSAEDTKKFLEQLQEIIPNLENKFFHDFFTQFFNFAIILSDKSVYSVLHANNIQFDIQHPKRANEMALFIFGKLLSDHKFLHLLIAEKLEGLKPYEKKFVLLEICLKYIPKLETRHIFFQTLLPNILKNLNQGVQKYMKIRQNDNQDDIPLNQKGFGHNFENWTLNYLNRLIEVLYNLPEIQQADGILNKRDHPHDQVKYFVLNFMCDMCQGFIEAIQQEKLFDQKLLTDFLEKQIKSLFPKIAKNESELVLFAYYQLRENQYIGRVQPKVIQNYSVENRLNIVATTYIFLNFLDKKEFQNAYSLDFKRKLLLVFCNEFFEFESQREEMIYKLIEHFTNVFKNPGKQQNIQNINIFDTPFQNVLLKILEPFGRAPKELQQKFFNSFQNCISIFNPKLAFKIYQNSFQKSENLELCSFTFGEFKKFALKFLQQIEIQPKDCPFIDKNQLANIIIMLINKNEQATAVDKQNIFIQILGFLYILSKQICQNSSEFENHILNNKYAAEINNFIKQQNDNIEQQVHKTLNELNKKKQNQLGKVKEKDRDEDQIERSQSQMKELDIVLYHIQNLKESLAEVNQKLVQQI